jgi:hypothetical protein
VQAHLLLVWHPLLLPPQQLLLAATRADACCCCLLWWAGVGNSSGETCARCSCVLMGAQLTADDDKADAAMRAYLQQLDLVDSDSAPACTTLAFKKAGVSEGVIEALASEPCSWEVARRQPVCGTIMAQVTGEAGVGWGAGLGLGWGERG